MAGENKIIFFPFASSIIVHLVVFLALYSTKPEKNLQRLSVRSPLSIAVLRKTPRTTNARKANTHKVATKAVYVKKAENTPVRKIARRKFEKHSKTTMARLVFQEIQPHGRENIKRSNTKIRAIKNKAHKKKVIASAILTTSVKKLSPYEVIKKRFAIGPKVKMRTIIAKLPKELFIKHGNEKADRGSIDKNRDMETLSARTVGLHKPEYPRYSRVHGEEGSVLISVRISANGKVEKIKLVHSSGYGRLDHAAVIALNDVNFIPARLHGRTVSSNKEIAFTFSLE